MPSNRPRVLIAACALLIPFAVACEPAADDPDLDRVPAAEPAPTADAPPAGIEAARDRYIAAWNGDDPAAVAQLYTQNATAVVGDTTYQGRAEIQEAWLQGVPTVSNLRVTETSARQVGNDWQSEGTYSLTASPPDEDPMEQTGRYSITWTRDADGQWRVRSSEVQLDEPTEG